MTSVNASGFAGVRLSEDSEKVTIAFAAQGGRSSEVTLPVIEVPELVLYLSRAMARHYADQWGVPVLAYTLPVHEADVVRLSNSSAAGLVLTLREGLKVSFSVPRAICAQLASQFAEAAETSQSG